MFVPVSPLPSNSILVSFLENPTGTYIKRIYIDGETKNTGEQKTLNK